MVWGILGYLLAIGIAILTSLVFSSIGAPTNTLGLFLTTILLSVFVTPPIFAWYSIPICRWLVSRVAFTDGTAARFLGSTGPLWRYFVFLGLVGAFTGLVPYVGQLIYFFAAIWIYLAIWRWFFENVMLEPVGRLAFSGEYWPFLGWLLLLFVSMVTVVGWAWVAAAWMRWIYRNVNIGGDRLVFCGTGWEILWRGIVSALVSIFIITMPWMAIWYIKWFVRSTTLQRASA